MERSDPRYEEYNADYQWYDLAAWIYVGVMYEHKRTKAQSTAKKELRLLVTAISTKLKEMFPGDEWLYNTPAPNANDSQWGFRAGFIIGSAARFGMFDLGNPQYWIDLHKQCQHPEHPSSKVGDMRELHRKLLPTPLANI